MHRVQDHPSATKSALQISSRSKQGCSLATSHTSPRMSFRRVLHICLTSCSSIVTFTPSPRSTTGLMVPLRTLNIWIVSPIPKRTRSPISNASSLSQSSLAIELPFRIAIFSLLHRKSLVRTQTLIRHPRKEPNSKAP